MMRTIIDQLNAQGRRVVVEVQQSISGRGRVLEARVRVRVDAKVVWEGPDGPEADRHWKPLLAPKPAVKRPRRKKGK